MQHRIRPIIVLALSLVACASEHAPMASEMAAPTVSLAPATPTPESAPAELAGPSPVAYRASLTGL